jgi:hypothetical protein
MIGQRKAIGGNFSPWAQLDLPGDAMTSDPAHLESILAPLRASFHAKRRERVRLAEEISRGLDAYVKAVDLAVARELCKVHGLATPAAADPPDLLAQELLRLVTTLPELRGTEKPAKPEPSVKPPSAPPDVRQTGEGPGHRLDPGRIDDKLRRAATAVSLEGPKPKAFSNLLSAMRTAPLIIVGGSPHLERLRVLPTLSAEDVEWIDTTRQGTHAIGNLERRIRDRRVAALVILEGLVQHRHSDPLVSAARSVELAHAFGGKGGRAAMQQAFNEIDSKLGHREHHIND